MKELIYFTQTAVAHLVQVRMLVKFLGRHGKAHLKRGKASGTTTILGGV
jgi:hypothetical protein